MRKTQLMVLAALAALGATAAPAQDRDADWLKRPTADDIRAVWPVQALQQNKAGKATISCTVTVQGTLRDCRVLEESPPELGFGSAAVALSTQFLMKPALKGGAAVVSTVRIPITFEQPHGSTRPPPRNSTTGSRIAPPREDEPAKEALVYTHLPWRQAPTHTEVLAAYPAKAKAEKVGGMAVLDCRLDKDGGVNGCRTIKEAPEGYGFAQGAKGLTDRFVSPVINSKGESIAGSRAHLTITFAASALDATQPVIGRPKWVALPTADDLETVIPDAARKAEVFKSRVVMSCAVVPEGKVERCAVQLEDPVGLGYGEAALSLARFFRLAVWTDEGLPTVGGVVRIPLRFDLESAVKEPTAKP